MSVKCIFWQIFNELLENQDSYIGTKTTFRFEKKLFGNPDQLINQNSEM